MPSIRDSRIKELAGPQERGAITTAPAFWGLSKSGSSGRNAALAYIRKSKGEEA